MAPFFILRHHFGTVQQLNTIQQLGKIARMFIFSWFIIFLQNHRATIARPSHDVRKNVMRRSLVINVLNFILQISILARPDDTSSRSLAFRPLHHG